MRALGICFSGRKIGNCDRCLACCLDKLTKKAIPPRYISMSIPLILVENVHILTFQAQRVPSGTIWTISLQCIHADVILWALPTYRGHLPATYFAFSERLEGYVQKGIDIETDIFRKVHIILIGNLSAGTGMAVHEALADFTYKSLCPAS